MADGSGDLRVDRHHWGHGVRRPVLLLPGQHIMLDVVASQVERGGAVVQHIGQSLSFIA